MTTTLTTTPVPVKAEGQSWDDFAEAIKAAVEAEQARLSAEFPTPSITAERGTDEWWAQFDAQRKADNQRSNILNRFQAKLIVSIGEALDAVVPNFEALRIEYSGSGDNGEDCDIDVDIKREAPTHTIAPYEGASPRLAYTHEENEAWLQASKDALALLPSELTEWLDETCWAIAYEKHPGFELDAGGYGRISVERNEAGEMKLTLTHTNRIEDVEEFAPVELA